MIDGEIKSNFLNVIVVRTVLKEGGGDVRDVHSLGAKITEVPKTAIHNSV